LLRGPPGPGKTSMMAPGDGAGNKAAALQAAKQAHTMLVPAMMAFPVGSPEYKEVERAVSSLATLVGKAEKTLPGAAGLVATAQAAKKGPLSASPPPGIAPTSVPPPGIEQPPGAEGEGAMQ
jgi:hypothetical protein